MRPMGFRIDNDTQETIQKTMIPCDFQHAICFGMTGSGKTASVILPSIQERMSRGHALIAYTYKGHEHKKIKFLAKEAGRLEDVIEIGKPHGVYINLMESLDIKSVHKVFSHLISGDTSKKSEDYWALSATKLGVSIVDILRKINYLDTLIGENLDDAHHIRSIQVKAQDEHGRYRSFDRYTYPKGEPSFTSVAKIVKSPKSLKKFFSGLDEVVAKVKSVLEQLECSSTFELFIDEESTLFEEFERLDKRMVQKIALGLFRLEEAMSLYKEFTINEDSQDGTGNNGVLQVLSNGLLSIAKVDHVNCSDIDLFEVINKGAVVIIDIEGLNNEVHGILLESMLSKLSSRIRHGDPHPVSVFVDEANRVLLGDMDIHNDTLREANVELILAAQNEEQMIEKFEHNKWQSILKNFKHHYVIDTSHYISYNRTERWKSEAVLLSDEEMKSSEYAFNSLPQNKKIFLERFMFEDTLPDTFRIVYDIVGFEKDQILNIIDENNNEMEVEYIGKKLKKRLKITMENLGYQVNTQGLNLTL